MFVQQWQLTASHWSEIIKLSARWWCQTWKNQARANFAHVPVEYLVTFWYQQKMEPAGMGLDFDDLEDEGEYF